MKIGKFIENENGSTSFEIDDVEYGLGKKKSIPRGEGSDIYKILEGNETIIENKATKIVTGWNTSTKYLTCENVEEIEEQAFYNNKSIISVNFPKCTSIKRRAFYNCQNLENVNFPSLTTPSYNEIFRSTSIKTATSENFPKLTYVGYEMFYGCNKLTDVDLPLVTSIGEGGFQQCYTLVNVNLPKVGYTSAIAFGSCNALVHIELPSLGRMYGQTFQSCIKLETVTLGNSEVGPVRINRADFWMCDSLVSITLPITSRIVPLNDIELFPASSEHHITIYVPSDLISSYQTATNWKTLYDNGYIDFQAIS